MLEGWVAFGSEIEFGIEVRKQPEGQNLTARRILENFFVISKETGAFGLNSTVSKDMTPTYPSINPGRIMRDNGSMIYLDQLGHPEAASYECATLDDLVLAEESSRMTLHAMNSWMRMAMGVDSLIFANNTDHHISKDTKAVNTFAHHLNIATNGRVDSKDQLLPFLACLQVITGSGMFLTDDLISKYGKDFVLSPRAMAVNSIFNNRLLVGGSADLLMDGKDSRNVMHVASLDTNMDPFPLKFGAGATILATKLVESGWRFGYPVDKLGEIAGNFHDISLAKIGHWFYRTSERTLKATSVLRIYFEAAQRMFGGVQDADTQWVFKQASRLLDALDKDPLSLKELDWVRKLHLAEEMGFMGSAKERVEFDRSYHLVDPKQNVYAVKVRNWSDDPAVVRAQNEPPKNTRALGRSKVVIDLSGRVKDKPTLQLPTIDWDKISGGKLTLRMPNPLKTYRDEASAYLANYEAQRLV